MLLGEKGKPGVPLFDVIGHDEADVMATLEQLNLCLWLVIEVPASPGPGLAGGRLHRNDHDAA